MIKKGKVASIDSARRQVKIVYEENEIMIPNVYIASHIDCINLHVNDVVIVACLDDNIQTGVVIGVIS